MYCFKPPILIVITCLLALFFSSCNSTKLNGYQYNISKISINTANHNLEYQFPSNNFFLGSAQNQIDIFDASFLANLDNYILAKGYSTNQVGQMQTMQLKDCLIEFSQTKPELIVKHTDSLYVKNLLSTIVCQQIVDTGSLFFASLKTNYNLKLVPINSFNLNANDSLTWNFSKNYAYAEVPFTKQEMQNIANDLAKNTVEKIDTINKVIFNKKYPDIYQSKYKKSNPNGGSLFLLTAMLALLIIVVIP